MHLLTNHDSSWTTIASATIGARNEGCYRARAQFEVNKATTISMAMSAGVTCYWSKVELIEFKQIEFTSGGLTSKPDLGLWS